MINQDMSPYCIKITLDDNVPEYMDGIIRCNSVVAEDEDGNQVQDYPDLVDNTEFSSQDDMVTHIAAKLNVSTDIVIVE